MNNQSAKNPMIEYTNRDNDDGSNGLVWQKRVLEIEELNKGIDRGRTGRFTVHGGIIRLKDLDIEE